jgi:hypothetical protein
MTMYRSHRREFLADVGRGMLLASVGSTLAQDLGLVSSALADADGGSGRLTFGPIEPLVALMQQTPAAQILPAVMEKLKAGTDPRQIVAAAALANARTFGGQDYEGYHAMMALAPAYQMSLEMPVSQQALPILKVLYRNTSHIQEMGGVSHEVLHQVVPSPLPAGQPAGEALRELTRHQDFNAAERAFAGLVQGPLNDAYNDLQFIVQDFPDVHRVVLAWRAWALLDLTGKEYAHTLLRQSVRFCCDEEGAIKKIGHTQLLRSVLPPLLERAQARTEKAGDKQPGDLWVSGLAQTIYGSSRERAAEAAAEALIEGVSPEVVGEAISLAANQLVLHDPGRRKADSPQKPIGSVHGASVGVHASDAANAWRNIARVSNRRNMLASLIVGAFHTAGQSAGLNPNPYPFEEHCEKIKGVATRDLLAETETAIKAKDQVRACALMNRYCDVGEPPRPALDLLLKYAISEDGALHAEKYYRTVTEEYAATRPSFRARQLAALARVTASEYGYPAPGIDQARQLIKA